MLGQRGDNGTKDVEIIVKLRYLSNFWTTLEMSFINCEINLILIWLANCIIKSGGVDQATTFAITDTKLYVPVVTLSTEHNAKQLQQLKSGFERTVNWNNYQSKVTMQTQNPYLEIFNWSKFWRSW